MKTKEWILLWALGLLWGTSFMWIKIAVADVSPLVLVGFRTLIASLGLGAIVYFYRKEMPRWSDLRGRIWDFVIIALCNIAIPWALISWGEQYVDSGIASILNSTMPLFTIIIAPLMIKEERITLFKVIGLIVGFLGVILLALPNVQSGWSSGLIGMAACQLAAIFYAFTAVYARKKTAGIPPQMQSLLQLSIGTLLVWIAIFATEGIPAMPTHALTWVAFVWLGLLGSCIAYIFYFYLLHRIGPTRVSTTTYITPMVAVLLGITFLGEPLYWQSMVGAGLILSGIFIINQRDKKKELETAE
jgi:drug/metabolite transporter (DMT)-like permease